LFKGILEEMTPLVGNLSSGARFGTTIAAVGDMNQDGFKGSQLNDPLMDATCPQDESHRLYIVEPTKTFDCL
jgi:hypothetical protein